MNTQPEALRLADDLDKYGLGVVAYRSAAELRRLHEVNQELVKALELLRKEAGDDGDLSSWFIKEVVDSVLAKARGTE